MQRNFSTLRKIKFKQKIIITTTKTIRILKIILKNNGNNGNDDDVDVKDQSSSQNINHFKALIYMYVSIISCGVF